MTYLTDDALTAKQTAAVAALYALRDDCHLTLELVSDLEAVTPGISSMIIHELAHLNAALVRQAFGEQAEIQAQRVVLEMAAA